MADQTQRLEIATVKAEVGSNILFRFANDATETAAIPTDSGSIPNLKQVITEIQEDGAEKISIATTIYQSAAAGLAATADGGIYLVQSADADEIYTVWKNEAGAAVNTGKTAMSSQAIQDALTASNEAAQAAEDAADVATNRTAGFLQPAADEPTIRDDGLPLQVGDRYFNTEAQTEYIYNSEGWRANESQKAISALKEDLSDADDPEKGAALTGFDGGTVADALIGARVFASYAALRAYRGIATFSRITRFGHSGEFWRDDTDTASAEVEGITIIDALGRRWKRDFQGVIHASWFQYTGAEIGAAVNAACAYASSLLGGGSVSVGGGAFTTALEIKVPSFVELFGAGLGRTSIKGVNALPVDQNIITNAKNNRLSRTDNDQFITVRDMLIDSNWQGRDPAGTGALNDQGCGVKLSACRDSHILRVKSVNAPLHCIDICASAYLNDGNINSQAVGPSLDCTVTDCVAVDPQRDDGITTHNSGRIQILRCKSFFNGTPGDTQQGVEIDEGSWDITVADCYAQNFQKGFQAKGHDTTIPAKDVRFVRCTAEDCTYSFEASHLQVGTALPEGQVYWARNVSFEDCISINVKPSAVYATAKDLSLTGYIGLTVKNLTVYGTKGIITIDKGANHVEMKGVTFVHGSILSGEATGRIHAYAPSPTLPHGQMITIEDVSCQAPMSIPIIRCSSAAARKRIRNVTAIGSDDSVAMIVINVSTYDEVSEMSADGYAGGLRATSNSMVIPDKAKLEPGLRYSLYGAGVPEKSITMPIASIYGNNVDGAIYRKTTISGNTGWIAI